MSPPRPTAAKVLLVDDSPTVREVIKIYLMGLPYEFLDAENGERGLRLLKLMTVHLVIADVRMPVMDGIELTRQIRALALPEKRDVPIILLTGEAEESLSTDGLAAGANAFVRKPITAEGLRQVIQQVLPPRP